MEPRTGTRAKNGRCAGRGRLPSRTDERDHLQRPGCLLRPLPRRDHARGETIAGVESVEVDLDAKTVVVTGDPLDPAAIVAAIDDAGFEVAGAAQLP